MTTVGVFSWTPTEAQGPSTNQITVRVTDNATPALSDTKTFTVVVSEVNRAPELSVFNDLFVHAGETILVTAHATDPDLPANQLRYYLDQSAPSDASVEPVSGEFIWTVPLDATASTNTILIQAKDDGSPALADVKSFQIIVGPQVKLSDIQLSATHVTILWVSWPGRTYRVQRSLRLDSPIWEDLPGDVRADNGVSRRDDPISPGGNRFYRVIVLKP